MSPGMSRFPDPYQTRDDLSHATVFLIALMLLLVVGAVLFFGNAWLFAPVGAASLASAPMTTAVTTVHRSTPVSAPTFTAPTQVPPLAGVLLLPTPAPSLTSVPPSTPTSTAQPAPAMAIQPPDPLGTDLLAATAHVGNTGGDGVFLRHTPSLNDRWVAWMDRTPLLPTGNQANGDGQHWLQVRDPKGNVGWVPAQYVVP